MSKAIIIWIRIIVVVIEIIVLEMKSNYVKIKLLISVLMQQELNASLQNNFDVY